MRTSNYSVLIIGLLAFGFLAGNNLMPWGPSEAQAAGEPVILFEEPTGTPRFTKTGDPVNPAETINPVTASFDPVPTPCSGELMPVERGTLDVNLHRLIDGASQESWDVDLGSWTWDPVDDRVTGQVTIGGPDSGQDRSLYGIQVCISNAADNSCRYKGVRMEHPVSTFTAQTYATCKGTSFAQTGAACDLIPSIAFNLINEEMAATSFLTIVPSASEITGGTGQAVFIGIPLLGSITMPADPTLDTAGNNVILNEVAVSDIVLEVLGMTCVISGKADGSLMGEVSPGLDLDGSIRVYDINVTGAGCTLVADETCELHITFDGNP